VGERCAASQQQKIHLNKQHCCISVRLHVQLELTKLLSGADPDLELRTEVGERCATANGLGLGLTLDPIRDGLTPHA